LGPSFWTVVGMGSSGLKIELEHVAPSEAPRGGVNRTCTTIERDGQIAWLHVPDAASGPLPLLVVLHGAGKDSMWTFKEGNMSVDAWAARAQAHGMLVLYPAARGSTWDYISSNRRSRKDFDFITHAINRVRRSVHVDDKRIALLGISDGGSMALSLASHNPDVFQAALSISAGFCAAPPRVMSSLRRAPKMFVKHGADDSMFPLQRVGLPLRDQLLEHGYDVEHRVGKGEGGMFGPAGHVPPGWHEEFLPAWLSMQAA